MQLKLLNFHKMLANFSTSLIGSFIPLIIYKQTQSLTWAVAYLIGLYATNIILNMCFKKLYVKYPQLFLLLRALPILAYSLAILLIDVNFIWGLILVMFFFAMNNSFRSNSNEIILNYSTVNQKDSKGLGITRAFEQFGNIIALIMGGLFLDYLDTYILIILALSIYLISCVPLLVYYIKSKKEKGFNAESISNAYLALSENPDKSAKGKKLANRIIMQYSFVYFLFCFLDNLCDLFNLFMYVKHGQFAIAGYLSASYNFAYALSSYAVGYISAKYDTTILSSICMVINGIMVIILPFVNSIAWIFVIYIIIGISYPPYSVFILDRLLAKARILGISNRSIFARENSACVSKLYCLLFALFGTLIPAFIAMGLGLFSCSAAMPENEETTRKALVNYLEGE